MEHKLAIHWFRKDLRLSDNPALLKASQHGQVLPIFILDDHKNQRFKLGSVTRWWLHQSLSSLNRDLKGTLHVFTGTPSEIIKNLIETYAPTLITWSKGYEPWEIKQENELKTVLDDLTINYDIYNSSLLWEPHSVLKNDGTPYRVFTPFYRNAITNAPPPKKPFERPNLALFQDTKRPHHIDSLHLLPQHHWHKKLEPHWKAGESEAHNKLKQFIKAPLDTYQLGRDYPSQNNTSNLSPYLHFGEISINTVWHNIGLLKRTENIDRFLSQLVWREFAHHLLIHFPFLPEENLQKKFDRFPWSSDTALLNAWQTGQTGYPIVDAGMRELWQTGYMHNRLRMIVGSFLVKNLLLDWRLGEKWFWDCLVDADLANNSMGWQWVSGCGADAAPYFRIFNPITQGHKFDAKGHYTKHYVPELEKLPLKYLFSPWEAPASVLENAGIILGKTYPHPIVNLKESRERALNAFKSI